MHGWGAFLVAQLAKNPPAMQETLVRFLGQKVPLEKREATHSSILAWRIPGTEDISCGIQSMRSQSVRLSKNIVGNLVKGISDISVISVL